MLRHYSLERKENWRPLSCRPRVTEAGEGNYSFIRKSVNCSRCRQESGEGPVSKLWNTKGKEKRTRKIHPVQKRGNGEEKGNPG